MGTGEPPEADATGRHQGTPDTGHRPGAPRYRWVPNPDAPPGVFLGDEGADGTGAQVTGGGDAHDTDSGTDTDDRGRLLAVASGAAVLALLPLCALALVPFWAVLNLVASVPFPVVLLVYLAAGVVLLVPAVQRLVLAAFFDARTPTPRELETLEPAWHNVLDAAGRSPDGYVLAVTDTSQLDAVATGGRIVAVSRLALNALPAHELEASLAHELGHRLDLQRVGRLAALWLEAPLLLFARLGVWLELAAYGLALWFAFQEHFGAAVAALLGGLAIRAGGHLVPAAAGAAGLVHSIRNTVGRYSIYRADRHAVDLGYGDDLVDLLERMVEYQMEGEEGRQHVLGSHSLITKRIERIEEQLA